MKNPDKIRRYHSQICVKNNKLTIELPLTTPTGKIRVKRMDMTSNYGLSISTKEDIFTKDDYVEWQISYATLNPPKESKVDNITINDNQIGFELTKLLYEGVKLGILSNDDVNELEIFIRNVQTTETLEENEAIFRENNLKGIKGGFKKFVEKVPMFIKKNKNIGYFVEIALRHRDYAVGLQSMVYLCIYIKILKDKEGNSLLGRAASINEFAELEISLDNKAIVIDVAKAFAIASQQHRSDMLNILEQIKRKCKLQ